jgi:hypothetical protein
MKMFKINVHFDGFLKFFFEPILSVLDDLFLNLSEMATMISEITRLVLDRRNRETNFLYRKNVFKQGNRSDALECSDHVSIEI